MGFQTDLASVLRERGVDVVETAGWQNRGSSPFDPVGIVNHHTAGGTASQTQELGHILRDVLANIYISREPRVYLIAAGRTAHAGIGLLSVRDRVAQDLPPLADAAARGTTSVNRWYVGIEVENNGVGEPYSLEQLDLLVRVNAAICRARGWTHNRCIHHRESTSRKVDMSWRGDLRGSVALWLLAWAAKPVEPPLPVPSVVEFAEDDVKTAFLTIPLDDNGNGWRNWNPGFGRDPHIVGLVLHGPYPPSDGYWAPGLVQLEAQARGGEVIVSAEHGRARGNVNVFVSVA